MAIPEARPPEQDVVEPEGTDRNSQPGGQPRAADTLRPVSARPATSSQLPEAGGNHLLRPGEQGRMVVLEQVFSRRPYDISYACLLIPRFSSHRLTGDVVAFLRDSMLQICVSFGWRLDYVMVRPEYLQWVISAPATTPPSRSIRTIRELSSKKIFEDFPHYKEENLGNDFWAPAYLVLVGPTPHPPETIIEFIRVTRQEQGILPRRGQ